MRFTYRRKEFMGRNKVSKNTGNTAVDNSAILVERTKRF